MMGALYWHVLCKVAGKPVDLAQSQNHLPVILNLEEHFVGSEFFVAETVLAEAERSVSRDLVEGIPLLHERRGHTCPSSPRV